MLARSKTKRASSVQASESTLAATKGSVSNCCCGGLTSRTGRTDFALVCLESRQSREPERIFGSTEGTDEHGLTRTESLVPTQHCDSSPTKGIRRQNQVRLRTGRPS